MHAGRPGPASLRWLKPGVFVGALVPLVGLLCQFVRGTLGAQPVSVGLNRLGLLALVFLLASLACTPAKFVCGWTWAIALRRMLGLFAFFYATLHLLTYVALDQHLDWSVLWADFWPDVSQREFMLAGLGSFLLLVPLAATSTSASLRRLGYPSWKALHRLVYPAALLAALHFLLRVKPHRGEQLSYALLVVALLLVRMVAVVRTKRARARGAEATFLLPKA
jgi:methionine sulfoxide reductase heme-binding subunit